MKESIDRYLSSKNICWNWIAVSLMAREHLRTQVVAFWFSCVLSFDVLSEELHRHQLKMEKNHTHFEDQKIDPCLSGAS